MRFKEFFKRYFVVHKCGGCREILDYEHVDSALCDSCMLRFNMAKTETCPVCSQSAVECTCMPKGLSKSGALCLRKLCFYSASRSGEAQNRLIYLLKKKKIRRIASFIAEELKGCVLQELDVLGADVKNDAVIVGVPRGLRARAVYGFDQSELIGKELSSATGIPYVNAIKRRRGGKEQKGLDRDRRFRNSEALFKACDGGAVSGKYVILYDDVVTTGASMAACTKILKKSGALGVICLCIAED